jgi:hypothetical protein
MKDLIELTTTTETTSWIPVDSYADLILEGAVAYGQLSGVITAVNHDFTGCQGKIIQVRSVNKRTAQDLGAVTGKTDCLSATSQTVTTYSITLKVLGDYDEVGETALFQTCGDLKAQILNEMAKGIAEKQDQDIITELLTAGGVPSVSFSLASAMKCFTNYPNWVTRASGHASAIWGAANNLYDGIVHSVGSMRNNAYEPDYLILNPNVAAFLKINYDNRMLDAMIDYDKATGKLTRVAGLKVIETPHAETCKVTSAATMAIVIDSSRAVGEAWGKRPQYTEVYEPECLYFKEVISLFWAAGRLDPLAIGHIRNP